MTRRAKKERRRAADDAARWFARQRDAHDYCQRWGRANPFARHVRARRALARCPIFIRLLSYKNIVCDTPGYH